ncbi:MAG: hypothetical protein WCA21_14760 [Terracidiphilus sp.]
MVFGVAALTASASLIYWQNPGLLLGAGNGLSRWLENAEAGSGVERALYRMMKLPGGAALYRRSPGEARGELTTLISTSKNGAALYSLRAMEDEKALDFEAAERDWRSWAEKADDKPAANLDLADFYERRLKPQEELAALEVVGNSGASPQERWTAAESQRSWKAWEQTLSVVEKFALPRVVAAREYASWEVRYPQETSVYERELNFDLAGKDLAAATALIARYRKAFPGDDQFPVRAEADVEARHGSAKDGLAVFDRSFQPLWPVELVKSYYELLESGHQTLKTRDELRARLAANPAGGADALKDAAKLFYIFQQEGQLETAKSVLAEYRERKDAQGAVWSPDELYTLGRLLEDAQDFSEAARYYYALAAEKQTPDAEEKGLSGLTRILLTAPEQPLRVGAGNLALYKSIATMDRGPGYLNGILSLLFNSQQPASEYSTEDQLAVPYFHRAKAAELLEEIDRRFPNSAERAELHAKLMDAYAAYGENDAVIREGTAFLAHFPSDARRVQVALAVADVYSRTDQAEKEFALYKSLLAELASKADGVPLGTTGAAYSKAVCSQSAENARCGDYGQVLDRYLSRLVAMERLPDALQVLRGELDRNPQDPGLYEKLAQFLDQNRLNENEEEVYQRAIAQFQQTSFATEWYAKLARFYLRQRREAEYSALSHKVTGIFSGTDLEEYLNQAPAPDWTLSLEVNRYAHDRFPHDLTFVRNLLGEYRSHWHQDEVEKLLMEHWSESPDLRDQLFELLSSTGKLDEQLQALRQQEPEIDKGDWSALSKSNPAAERFWLESCLWQSRFEDGVGAADALAAEYPSDETLGEQASSLYRSLAYFHPEDTDKAIEIEKRLLSAWPGDLDRLARIGDIYADRGRFSDAAPYWERMAEVHPGDANGYLQSATVFWDYFDFASASAQLRTARERLADPALFSYQAGAIEESQNNLPGAIKEYVAGSLAEKPSEESRTRLLTLAGRPDLRASVEAETEGLLKPASSASASPSSVAIDLRVSVLDAEHRSGDIKQELKQVIARTESFDVLDAVTSASRADGLTDVEQLALRRQIELTTDPSHAIELRYQLVDLLQQHDPASAIEEVDTIYREHPKVLGVVRATVDFDWSHGRKPQAVTVLLESAEASYPELKQKFQLEAARKLTELSEYPRAKNILETLLNQKPLDAAIETALADNYAHSGDQVGLEAFYRAQLAAVKAAALDREEMTERIAQLRRGMISAAELLGNWSDAADQYIELINAYPDDADLVQEAALMAGAHEQRDKLVAFYSKTIVASPHDARWSIVLARLETALEDYPAAIEAFAKAIRIRPEQKDLYDSKANLEERLYRLDDAVADYEQLYKLSYRDPQWKLKSAAARARQGRNADAIKSLEEAWIEGRPVKAANNFAVASQLEQWGLLSEARSFAEKGVDAAGAELLTESENQSGAAVYARIMARLRLSDTAFTRLAIARQQAESLTFSAVAQQVAKEGLSAITDEDWRKQRILQNKEEARSGFAQALKSMAEAAGQYSTPEEKAQFAAWLQIKLSGAADGSELRVVYLPAVQAAGLTQMESDLLWKFAENSGDPDRGELDAWLQLQRQRVQLDGIGAKLEKLASSLPYRQYLSVLQRAAKIYQTQGDSVAELRVLDRIVAPRGIGAEDSRYLELSLAARPQELVDLASRSQGAQETNADSVTQYLIANAKPDLALSGVAARSSGLPPVWKKAYIGLTGLYLREHTPLIRASFGGALGGDATIGERIAHPANRDEQLAGEAWFYYGSRYGEYLDEEKDAQAEGYLESELEHTPESADVYAQLADYSSQTGRIEAALADYQHSLDLKSDQPAVLDSIAVLEWKQGHQADALAAWQLAVKRLAAEMDARHVPESFWEDFAQVTGDVAAHQRYGAIGEEVDAMLRAYLEKNGDYRVEPLLQAGYHARVDSMEWLIGITAAASDSANVLSTVQQSSWIAKGQTSRLLARIVELERRKAQAKPDEPNWSLDHAESHLIDALLDERKFAEARAEFARIPEVERNTSQWLSSELRLSDAEGSLPQLIVQWKKMPEIAPSSSDLQNNVQGLSQHSRQIVMRFVYERSIDARELTAPNFLGLAGIDLDEGDTSGAVALLKRLTLISDSFYTDMDSAASLLESHRKLSEVIQFLQPLTQAFPWNASYKIRLAQAMLAGNAQSQQALSSLQAVTLDPKATYAERMLAAKSLRGLDTANPATGSAELDLLARTGCLSESEVSKPYFIEARKNAAACVVDKSSRERLLLVAMAASPGDTDLRMQYVAAAFAVGQNVRALVAAEPVLQNGSFYGQRAATEYDSSGYQGDDGQQQAQIYPIMKPEDAAKLTWFAIHAREKRNESQVALSLAQSAASSELDPSRLQAFQNEAQRLETEASRVEENEARAPKIHAELDQDRVVRPRLLPGDPFVPSKKAKNEEDAE